MGAGLSTSMLSHSLPGGFPVTHWVNLLWRPELPEGEQQEMTEPRCVPESMPLVFLATLKQSQLTGRPIHQICHFCPLPKSNDRVKDHTPIAEAQQDFKCSRCTRTDFETKGSTNTMNPRLSFESGRISYFSFKDPELKLTYSLPQVGTFARVRAQT